MSVSSNKQHQITKGMITAVTALKESCRHSERQRSVMWLSLEDRICRASQVLGRNGELDTTLWTHTIPMLSF